MKQMPDLRGVMLEDSWVLGWAQEHRRLTFRLEASLHPPHPAYEQPRPGEWACYRTAVLTFEDVESIQGLRSMTDAPSTTDPDGSKDYGSIDAFSETRNGYVITGDFGEVIVEADRCSLSLL
ncbi:MAG: hypothetical protein J0M16_06285 [Gammaproteobacteria bacterium]|nr:hypothetical protein [Gammaproteobacteria bacterium]